MTIHSALLSLPLSGKERAVLTVTLERERLLAEYIQTLNGVEPYDMRIETVLVNLGAHFQANRTYIFRLDDGKNTNLFEWCREGVARGKGSFQNVDDAFARGWFRPSRKARAWSSPMSSAFALRIRRSTG